MAQIRHAVVQGRGHPLLRCTHASTLELTAEPAVTARATCVAGVGAVLDAEALGLLRGRVALTLTAAGHQAAGEATINPGHQVRDRLVIRRSHRLDPYTLAVDSTLTAAALPPALTAALADPDTAVTLTVTELEPPPLLVLACEQEPAGRLGLLWRHADGVAIVAASLAEAGRWAAGAGQRGSAGQAATARFAVPGAPQTAALLAAGLPPDPALWLGRVGRQAARRPPIAGLLQSLPVPAVLTVRAGEAAAVLGRLDPAHPVAVPDDQLDAGTGMTWSRAAPAAERLAGTEALVVLAAHDGAGHRADLRAVLTALAAAGVSPRTLSEALAPFGLTRRQVYGTLSGPRRAESPHAGGPG